MRRKLSWVLLLSTIFTFVCLSQASALSMDLVVSDSDIIEGETFRIDVWAKGVFDDPSVWGDEVLAFGFDIVNSDSSIVSLDSWAVGFPFDDDSAFHSDTDVAGSTFPGLTDDDILLSTLSFSALSPGNVTLGISSDILDPNEGLVYFFGGNVDIDSSIDVNVAPVPEPATVLLVGAGLIGLAGSKKKFKKS